MNEDVISKEAKGSFLTRRISSWWLLVPAILLAVPYLQSTRPEGPARTNSRILGRGIADAVIQYSGDYRCFPKPLSHKDGEDTDTDSSNAAGLIKILIGHETDNGILQNRLKIDYLEGMKTAKARTGLRNADAKGSDKWIGGLVLEENNFEMVDGWGSYYRIRLDSNYDGEILNPNTDEVGDGRGKLPNHVIVWSPGKDGKWETWEDNVKSWD